MEDDVGRREWRMMGEEGMEDDVGRRDDVIEGNRRYFFSGRGEEVRYFVGTLQKRDVIAL